MGLTTENLKKTQIVTSGNTIRSQRQPERLWFPFLMLLAKPRESSTGQRRDSIGSCRSL